MTTRHKSVLLAVLALCGLLALGAGVQLVVASGEGADFANVFKEPATAVTTEADITWTDGEPLLRTLEPQTLEAIEFAWVRSIEAVERAGAEGDTSGVDVWFAGPAKTQVLEILATGAIAPTTEWTAHDFEPNFYSIDGQIFVAHIDRATANEGADTVRAVFILRDGNWRVEHLTRVAAASTG